MLLEKLKCRYRPLVDQGSVPELPLPLSFPSRRLEVELPETKTGLGTGPARAAPGRRLRRRGLPAAFMTARWLALSKKVKLLILKSCDSLVNHDHLQI